MGCIVIGVLLSGLFNLILNLVATILQVILLPVNALFNNVFPDLSEYINLVVVGFSDAMSKLGWILSVIPQPVKTTLLFIFTIEVSIIVIMKSTKLTSKLWKLLQKIKFW